MFSFFLFLFCCCTFATVGAVSFPNEIDLPEQVEETVHEFVPGLRSSCIGLDCLNEIAHFAKGHIDYPSKCSQNCQRTYSTPVSCANDDGCRWSPTLNVCSVRCELLDHPDLCTTPFETIAAGPAAITGTIYYTPILVASDAALCFWNMLDQTCRPRCPHLSVDECGQHTEFCQLSDNGKKCIHKCDDLSDGFLVNDFNASGVYNVSHLQNLTRDGLSRDERRVICHRTYQDQCTFEVNTNRCTPSCFARFDSNQTLCDLADGCVWSNATEKCYDACELYAEHDCGTTGSRHCYWHQSLQTCLLRCDFLYSVQSVMNNNTVAEWCRNDGSACAMFTGSRTQNTRGPCAEKCSMWDGNATACDYIGHRLIDSSPSSWSDCTYVATNTSGECKTACFNFSKTDCNGQSYCEWNHLLNQCGRKCSTLTAKACGEWWKYCALGKDDKCRMRCDSIAFTGLQSTVSETSYRDACGGDANNCEMLDSRCRQKCSTLSEISCVRLPHCLWRGASCSTKCTMRHLNDQAACEATGECEWFSTAGCTDQCHKMTNQTDCDAASPNCRFNPWLEDCQLNCRVLSLTDCSKQAHCQTTNSECHFRCSDAFNVSACMDMVNYNYETVLWYSQACEWVYTQSGPACRQRCNFAHTTSTACDSDPECEWFEAARACDRQCPKVNASLEACETLPRCRWMVDKCFSKCSAKYIDEPSCKANSQCTWLNSAGLCAENCNALLNTSARCDRVSHCILDPNATTCELDCRFRHNDATACNNDEFCQWTAKGCARSCAAAAENCTVIPHCAEITSTTTKECVLLCEYFPTDSECNAANPTSRCEWSGLQSQCLPSCAHFASVTECHTAYPGCVWHTSKCRQNCALSHNTESACNADSSCVWNATSAGECSARCSTLTYIQCRIETQCSWIWQGTTNEAGFCVATANNCLRRKTKDGCEVDSECDWHEYYFGELGHCAQRCSRLNHAPIACVQIMTHCVYNFWNTTCDVKCSIRHPNIHTWNGTVLPATYVAEECTGERFHCDYVTGQCRDSCLKYQENVWYQTRPTRCGIKTSLQTCLPYYPTAGSFNVPGSQASCESQMLVQSIWSWANASQQCVYDCHIWTGLSASKKFRCRSNSHCVSFPDGRCELSCNKRHNFESTCAADPECDWIGDPGWSCLHKCDQFTDNNATECNVMARRDGQCHWDVSASVCKRNCGNLSTAAGAECETDSRCEVFSNGVLYESSCLDRCSNMNTETLCLNAVSYCYWDAVDSVCFANCASKWTTQTGCSSMSQCYWSLQTGTCEYDCKLIRNPASCQGSALSCFWDEPTNVCKKRCASRYLAATLAVNCTADTECVWDNFTAPATPICREPCHSRTATYCVTSQDCIVSPVSGKCAWRCDNTDARFSEASCTVDNLCTWTSGICHQCSVHSTGFSCQADAQCTYFATFKGNCQLRCSKYVTQAACNSATQSSGCQWTKVGCREPCSLFLPTMCKVMSHCRFDEALQRCENSCLTTYDDTECANDNLCQLYPHWDNSSTVTGFCRERCTLLGEENCKALSSFCVWTVFGMCEKRCNAFYSPSTRYDHVDVCSQDSVCTLYFPSNAVSPECRHTCARLSETGCTSMAHCVWSSTNLVCYQRCEVDYPSPGDSSCPTSGRCSFDKIPNITHPHCVEKCAIFDTNSTCSAEPHCIFFGKDSISCQSSCRSLEGTVSTSSCASSLCTNVNGQCYEKCELFADMDTCERNAEHCIWKRGRCSFRCRFQYSSKTQRECRVLDESCDTGPTNTGCDEACSTYGDIERCINSAPSYCIWYNDTRQCIKNCWLYSTGETCVGDSDCTWQPIHGSVITSSVCRPKCELFLNETSCMEFNAIVGGDVVHFCEWSRGSEVCLSSCFQRFYHDNSAEIANDTTSCNRHSHCQAYKSELTNGIAPTVTFATGMTCLLACPHRTNRTACDQFHPYCHWNTDTSACYLRCRIKHGPNKQACLADDTQKCDWFQSKDNGNGQCGEPCEQFKDRSGCLGEGCLWDAKGSQCLMDCVDRWENATTCNTDLTCGWSTVWNRCNRRCEYYFADYSTCPTSLDPSQTTQDCIWAGSHQLLKFSLKTPLSKYNATVIKQRLPVIIPSIPSNNVQVTPKFVACRFQYFTVTLTGTFDQMAMWESEMMSKQGSQAFLLEEWFDLEKGDPAVPGEEEVLSGAPASSGSTFWIWIAMSLVVGFI